MSLIIIIKSAIIILKKIKYTLNDFYFEYDNVIINRESGWYDNDNNYI